ncbi:transposase family protein [Streptomyces sp. Y7]|uniref:transposase family protein n=1 Tax=Streptomyces sp. Y7 TaxID=3342392 RepID=UPI00371858F9
MLVYPSGVDVSSSALRFLAVRLRERRRALGTRWRRLSAGRPAPCWAGNGYQGAGGTVRLPYRGRWADLSVGQQAVNRAHAKVRALVEQAVATLKSWRLLRKLRCSTTRITSLVRAVLTLHLANSD